MSGDFRKGPVDLVSYNLAIHSDPFDFAAGEEDLPGKKSEQQGKIPQTA
jgi:hypothetical protein